SVSEQISRIDDIDARVSTATATAEGASRNIGSLQRSVQENFNLVATEIGKSNGEIAKLQEAISKKSTVTTKETKSTEPVVAGPDEYVIKSGDSFSKIARAHGVSLHDITAVNP